MIGGMSILGRLVGTPQAPAGDTGKEVIEAREFDITQYGKKLAVVTAALATAVVAALEVFDIQEVTEALAIAGLAFVAVCLFSASLVMAVDMIARAIVTVPEAARGSSDAAETTDAEIEAVRSDLEVRIEGSDEMRPVLAISRGNGGDSFYVPTGLRSGDGNRPTFEGPFRWVPSTEVRACRLSQD